MSIHLWSNIAHDDVIRNVIDDGAEVPLENYSQLLAPYVTPFFFSCLLVLLWILICY
jgi:hypothetical protein